MNAPAESTLEKPMNPASPIAAVTQHAPYAYYAELAATSPLYRDPANQIWVACNAEIIDEVLAHPAARVRPAAEPVPKALLGSAAADIFGHLVRMNDGAAHCPFKNVVSSALDDLSSQKVAEQAQHWAEDRALELAHSGHAEGSYGWLDEFALTMPVYVVASLLGVPSASLKKITMLLRNFVPCIAAGCSAEQISIGKDAAATLLAEFDVLLESGMHGLLADLAQHASDRGCADRAVILANAIGFMSQACEATAGLIANTLFALAQDENLRLQVNSDAELLSICIQEVLRYDPPVQNTRRFLKEDCVIAGQQLLAGDAVLLVLAAANRDESLNPQAQVFDLHRSQRRYYTFGQGGHACPGRELASQIAQAAVSQLLKMDLDFGKLSQARRIRPSVNARIRQYAHAGS